jgi:hypothetical protein
MSEVLKKPVSGQNSTRGKNDEDKKMRKKAQEDRV